MNARFAVALPMVLIGLFVALMAWGSQSVSAQTFPAIDLDKAVAGGATEVVEGGKVTFTIVISNVGNGVPLQSVNVTDPMCALSSATKTGGDQDDLLEAPEKWSYTCVTTATTDEELSEDEEASRS